MRTSLHLLSVGLVAVLVFGASCMSSPEGVRGAAMDRPEEKPVEKDEKDEKEQADMQAPMMFREASLPKGFPPPGPVGQVILKDYPAYRAARTVVGAGTPDASNAMFQPLFRHIKSNQIAMTAPVEMTYPPEGEGGAAECAHPVAMAFMYADPKMTPTTVEKDVEVVDLPAMTVLSVTTRGGYEKSFEKGLSQLHDWMVKNPGSYELAGPPRFLGYNSPFVPWFLRIGETQLPVKPANQGHGSGARAAGAPESP